MWAVLIGLHPEAIVHPDCVNLAPLFNWWEVTEKLVAAAIRD